MGGQRRAKKSAVAAGTVGAEPAAVEGGHGAQSSRSVVGTSLAIFAVAFAVRLTHLWSIRNAPFFSVLIGDARGYDAWALRIAGGEWIGNDVFYQAPLYPYFLAVIYRVGGHSLMLVRILQAIVGSCSCVLLGWAARRFFSADTGVVAGLGLALYAPAIFFDGLLQKSVLDVFFVCLSLYLIGRITSTAQARTVTTSQAALWLALGVALGCLGLTRENALVFIVAIVAWAAWRCGLRASLAVLLGLAVILLPVAVRNRIVGDGFYLTTSQFGPNFFIGNHAGADGTYHPLRYGRGAPEYEREDATALAELARGRSLTPAEVSAYWTDRAIGFITSEPTAWTRLMGRKIALLFNTTEMADSEDQSTYADRSRVLRLLAPASRFGVLVPLALIGLIVTWPQRSRLVILYALPVGYASSVALFYVFARYRYPLVPFLMLFAAAGIVVIVRTPRHAYRSVFARDRAWRTAVQVAAVFGITIAVNWPIESAAAMRAVTESNLGLALDADHRLDEAIAHFRRAIAIDPDYAATYDNLATALREEKRIDEAIAACHQALALQPRMAAARYTLANLFLDEGEPALAIEQFQRAMSDEPLSADADVHNNLGIALASTGRVGAAVDQFQQALKQQPDMSGAHYNLARLLLQEGHAAEAIDHFQRALTGTSTAADVHDGLAVALASAGRGDEAAREFQRAIALAPTSAKMYRNYGDVLRSQGKTPEALAALQRAVELSPNDRETRADFARALNDHGVALGSQGHFAEAIEQFQRALALEPDFVQARHNLTTARQAQVVESIQDKRSTRPPR